MARRSSSSSGNNQMDMRDAKVWGMEAFRKVHPRETWPVWFVDGCVVSVAKNKQNRFVVEISLTLKHKREGIIFFQAQVDPENAEVTVDKCDEFTRYNPEEILVVQDPREYVIRKV